MLRHVDSIYRYRLKRVIGPQLGKRNCKQCLLILFQNFRSKGEKKTGKISLQLKDINCNTLSTRPWITKLAFLSFGVFCKVEECTF